MATTLQSTSFRTAGNTEIIVGIWLLLAPFLFGFNDEAFWSVLISGGVILILAFIQRGTVSGWPTWLTLLTGAWLLIAPMVIPYDTASTWNGLIAGIVIVLLSIWALMRGRDGTLMD